MSGVRIPVGSPILLDDIGVSPSGKATDFDSVIRRFESCYPSQRSLFDPLAQSAEHLTFNQGVRSSNLRWVTIYINHNHRGEVSEWFKELVLKTSDSERDRGFESHPLRQDTLVYIVYRKPWRSTQVAEEDGLLNR